MEGSGYGRRENVGGMITGYYYYTGQATATASMLHASAASFYLRSLSNYSVLRVTTLVCRELKFFREKILSSSSSSASLCCFASTIAPRVDHTCVLGGGVEE